MSSILCQLRQGWSGSPLIIPGGKAMHVVSVSGLIDRPRSEGLRAGTGGVAGAVSSQPTVVLVDY
jgi:hypothetical protein